MVVRKRSMEVRVCRTNKHLMTNAHINMMTERKRGRHKGRRCIGGTYISCAAGWHTMRYEVERSARLRRSRDVGVSWLQWSAARMRLSRAPRHPNEPRPHQRSSYRSRPAGPSQDKSNSFTTPPPTPDINPTKT